MKPLNRHASLALRHIFVMLFLLVLAGGGVSVVAHAQETAAPAESTAPATEAQPAAPDQSAEPPAQAAPKAAPVASVMTEQREKIEGLTKQVDDISKKVDQASKDDAGLVALRGQLEAVDKSLLDSGIAFRPRLAEINSRVTQLGNPPADGQPPEPEMVANERHALNTEKAEINVLLGKAEDLSVRVNGMVNKITVLRRSLFTNMLTKRYELANAFTGEVGHAVNYEISRLYNSVSSWLRFVVQFKFRAVLAATFFALLVAAVMQFGGRRIFGRLINRDPSLEDPSYLSRLSVAFWSTLLPTLAMGVLLSGTVTLYTYFNVLRGDIGVLLSGFFTVLFVSFFVNCLSRAVLSPDMPNWRLISIESRAAQLLVWLMTLTAFVVGLDAFMGVVSDTLSSPLSVTIVKSLVAALLVGVLLVLIGSVKPFVDEKGTPRPWPTTLRYLLYLIGLVTIVSALLGYVSFAQFVSQQIVITGALLATAYIGFLAASAISDEGAFADTSVGRWLKTKHNLEDTTLDQLGLVSNVLIHILIVIVFLPFILFQWGFQPGDLLVWLNKLATGFKIGAFSFSPLAIVTGVVVFVLGYFITRWFQGWLDGSVMARGKVDAGVRNSIRTVIGYAGIALAGLIGISSAGIDLSNLALVAGGLSLGIGFGLQNVVSNFVSGLILLAERPFKAGDWIVAGQVSGTVKKISVRATEIETFQRQTVILPNSELINGAVGNWTHRNKLGRVEIPVGVAHGSDVKRVHEILLDIARSHHMVLKNPEPFVLFAAFGESALNFEVRVFLADIGNGSIVQNDIRFAIVEAFDKENIEIPAPRRDIVVKAPSSPKTWSIDDEKAEAEYFELLSARARAAQQPAPRRRSKKPDPA
ncbi:potassium efflux system protein [Mesorhizobium soli]|uniref:mechanosensitive ion channel domain-containing protein n=1 Tax=Pseudaminobacter soli (ex Li et al. 2025) TaxID=1295366 RepID=UPI00247D82A9|nr:potassium efflux system protein [Mesorhizobium soli]